MARERPTHNYNRVNLHIVCQLHLQSLDLYTKHFKLLVYEGKSPLQKFNHQLYIKSMSRMTQGNTNPELNSCKSTHMSNKLTECKI